MGKFNALMLRCVTLASLDDVFGGNGAHRCTKSFWGSLLPFSGCARGDTQSSSKFLPCDSGDVCSRWPARKQTGPAASPLTGGNRVFSPTQFLLNVTIRPCWTQSLNLWISIESGKSCDRHTQWHPHSMHTCLAVCGANEGEGIVINSISSSGVSTLVEHQKPSILYKRFSSQPIKVEDRNL